MSITVDRVLAQRQHRVARGERRLYVALSTIGHAVLSVAFFWLPSLLAEPPEPIDAIAVVVVPPQALGSTEPPPPPPPKPTPKPETPPPPPPEPEPEPDPADDRPVLPEKKPPPPKPAPPPPPRQTPPPPNPSPPPPDAQPATPTPASPFARRQGAPTGDPLGGSKRETIGVEDPNFTYGYYLDRVVALIRENWVRPQTGATDALVHFRVSKDGSITSIELRRTSGDAAFDRAALRAVEASSPLPPLPRGYQRDDLGINMIVK